MEEKTLQKICLIVAVFGIFSLFLISQNLKPKELEISKISKEYLKQEIKITGIVTSITNKKVITIIEVSSQNSNIEIITYKEDLKQIDKGDKIEVIGTLDQYNNRLQIQAKTITRI